MQRQELKSLIRECLESVLTERTQDPTREEMLQFLRQQFGAGEGFEDSAKVAMYWFANHYHGGQGSNLYSVLSTSQFRPGPISRGPAPESLEADMYQALEAEYGGKEHQHGSEEDMMEGAATKILKHLDNNYYVLTPKQAKEFSVDGQLPRPGYEKKADVTKLQGYQADYSGKVYPLEISDTTTGWIQQTQSWGKPVWAIRLHTPMMDEMTGTGAVQGYMAPMGLKGPVPAKSVKHPKDVPAHRMNEVGWHDEESYKRSHGDTFDDEEETMRKSHADAEKTYQKDDAEALYVTYDSQMTGEEPFMMNGQKFQYVWAIYPSGKRDIGVYAYAGDVVYGYQAFRQRMGIKEAEIVDPTTGEVAPGPRDRFEMQPGGQRKPVPQKVNKAALGKALDAIGKMKNHEWRPLLDRAIKNYELFPDDGNDPAKMKMAMALQWMDENLPKSGAVREAVTPIRLKNLIKVV